MPLILSRILKYINSHITLKILVTILLSAVLWWLLSKVLLFIFKKLDQAVARTDNKIDDYLFNTLKPTRIWLFPIIFFSFLSHLFELPKQTTSIVEKITFTLTVFALTHILTKIVEASLKNLYISKNLLSLPSYDAHLKNLTFLVKSLIWLFSVLFLLDNYGFNIKTLIAGLGIGGIAVAMAAQAILGDFISAITISLDKPFEVGDYIEVGSFEGTVEDIGLKTTRIRSLHGELLVLANSDITSARIKNFQRMKKRRCELIADVEYGTEKEQTLKIPQILEECVLSQEHTEVYSSHFLEHQESSLRFQCIYWIDSPDGHLSLQIKNKINFEVQKRFSEGRINMAFPTQTIYTIPTNANSIN